LRGGELEVLMNFTTGLGDFRHSHEREESDKGRLSRPMAVLLAAAIPVACPALADDAQPKSQVRGLIEAGIIF